MERRGWWGDRCWRALGPVALLFSLSIPQVAIRAPLPVHAVAAVAGRPNLSTYAGALAIGKPTEVAQQPFGLAVLGRYTFVADPINHAVRLLIGNNELAFAGNGSMAVARDGNDPSAAQLAGPYAVAIGHVTQSAYQLTGFDIYIADTFGHQVRKAKVTVPPIDTATGAPTAVISTIAGTAAFGLGGDGGAATAAQLNSPYGVAWDDQHGVLFVADTLNDRVRAIDGKGIITSVIGAPLNHPRGLAVFGDGLYIADTYNNVVRRFDLTSGALTTVAGTGAPGYLDGVAGTTAQLRLPSAVALDDKGDLYIADTGNHVVRELTAGDKLLRTVAGNNKPGKSGDRGPAVLAQLSAPMGVAVRPNGDLVIADTGNSLVRVLEGTLSSTTAHNIHTEAGNGTPSFAGDGRPPAKAQFAAPGSVQSKLASGPPDAAVPAVTGQRYVVDTFNHVVRTFDTADTDPDNHTTADKDADDVSTLGGIGGTRGFADTSSPGQPPSRFAYPMGSALTADGTQLYVADTFNNVVRAIDLNSKAVRTVAGVAGQAGYGGDGGSAIKALLSYPTAVAVDRSGNLFIADSYNSRVREVIKSTGNIVTVAGTGRLGFSGEGGDARSGDLYFPYGVALDSANPPNLYITDSFNHRIRRVDAVSPDAGAKNVIRTVAGDGAQAFGDGDATHAHFSRPWSAAVDQGNMYVADYLNHRLRKVDLAGSAVSTLAGDSNGIAGLAGDVGPAASAQLDGPRALSPLGGSGAMLVADSFANRVRWLGVTQAGVQRTQVNFDPTNLSGQSHPQSVTVTSTGSGLLVIGAVDLAAGRNNFSLDPVKNTCAQARLEPGISCSFEVTFQPRALGSHVGSVVIPNDATGGPQLVVLNGQATAALVTLDPPALTINQPPNAPPSSASVTLTNNGDGQLRIISIGLDQGTDPDFAQSNNCPTVMTAHRSCQITITLAQIGESDKRTRTGRLTVRDDAAGNDSSGGGTSQSVPLTGSLAQAAASFNQHALTFTQNLGGAGGQQTLMLVNNGQAPLHLSAIHEDGDFTQTNNCPPVLAPGAGCAIIVTFLPTNPGERDGYIVVADDAIDSPQKIPVLGIATMALAQLRPDRLSFSANVGATTAEQNVILGNRGDGPLTISAITASGDFKVSPRCPAVLPAGGSCSIGVRFAPQAPGARSGSLIVTDDANSGPGSKDVVRLSGIAYQPAATLSASTLAPAINVGATAEPQSVAVTNTGDGVLTIGSVAISGPAAGDYVQSGACSGTLSPGSSCSITVRFTPRAYGMRAATLTVYDDGPGGSQAIALRGTGTAPRALLSGSYLNFGGQRAGSPSVPQSIVLFNAGNGPLSVSGLSLSGADFIMSSNCGGTLSPGASCAITVTFLPQAIGARSGIVTIIDNAGSQRFTLSGVGT